MIRLYPKKEIERLGESLGRQMDERQKASAHLCAPLPDGAYFLAFPYVDVRSKAGRGERICLYCGKGELAIFSDHPRVREIAQALSEKKPPFQALLQFFHMLTAEDVDALERMEDEIDAFEDDIFTAKRPVKGASGQIIALRRKLHRIRRYYDQLGEVIDALSENESGAVPEQELLHYAALGRRVQHLRSTGVYLSECVARVREAYQAQVDIEQNQIMKVFTVLSAVFMPLTLIAGWYGMNFMMPEYSWALGYPMVIALSVSVCTICYVLFRHKRWF